MCVSFIDLKLTTCSFIVDYAFSLWRVWTITNNHLCVKLPRPGITIRKLSSTSFVRCNYWISRSDLLFSDYRYKIIMTIGREAFNGHKTFKWDFCTRTPKLSTVFMWYSVLVGCINSLSIVWRPRVQIFHHYVQLWLAVVSPFCSGTDCWPVYFVAIGWFVSIVNNHIRPDCWPLHLFVIVWFVGMSTSIGMTS